MIEYIYYRLYRFMLRTPGKSTAETGSSALLSIILLFYILSIITIILFLLNYKLETSKGQTQAVVLTIAIALYALNYMHFEKSGRYLTLNDKFDNESSRQLVWRGIGVCIFALGSLCSIILVLIYRRS